MNLRITLIVLTLASIFNSVKAQDDNSNYGNRYQRHSRSAPAQQAPPDNDVPKGYVSVNSGLSSVMGSWGFGIAPQYDGNYALSGTFQTISAGIPLNHSNLGIALSLGFYDNPFDVNNFVGNVVYADPNQNRNYAILEGGDYTTINFMAGVFYTYPVKRFSFDARVMGGYISCNLPEIQYGAEQDASPYNIEDTWDISSNTARGFAYDLGIGVRYSLRRGMCIMLNGDILQASLPFSTNEVQQHIDNNGNITYYGNTLSGTVPISLFNISLGLGIQF